MTISDVREWLKESIVCPTWYSGALRSTDGEAIVIYNGKAYTNPVAIGGPHNNSYTGKGLRILVHWNKNIKDSELKAAEVYNYLRNVDDVVISGTRVIQITMRDPEPVFLGVDASGYYEYVIDMEMIIER